MTSGVNNTLKDGKHFLVFDFDNSELLQVWYELKKAQIKYRLPPIYIVNTGKENSYHAYCFYRCDFKKSVQIALECDSIDYTFVRFTLQRKHATLRITEKNNRSLKVVHTIESKIPETVSIQEFNSFTKYETGGV